MNLFNEVLCPKGRVVQQILDLCVRETNFFFYIFELCFREPLLPISRCSEQLFDVFLLRDRCVPAITGVGQTKLRASQGRLLQPKVFRKRLRLPQQQLSLRLVKAEVRYGFEFMCVY